MLVLVQSNGLRNSREEFSDGQAVQSPRSRNPLFSLPLRDQLRKLLCQTTDGLFEGRRPSNG